MSENGMSKLHDKDTKSHVITEQRHEKTCYGFRPGPTQTVCVDKEDSYSLDIPDLENKGIVLSVSRNIGHNSASRAAVQFIFIW